MLIRIPKEIEESARSSDLTKKCQSHSESMQISNVSEFTRKHKGSPKETLGIGKVSGFYQESTKEFLKMKVCITQGGICLAGGTPPRKEDVKRKRKR